jgi:hypothetical protein
LRTLGALALLACALGLSACGSSGPATTQADAISRLQDALKRYDEATPGDVASTGVSCRDALNKLNETSLLATPVAGRKETAADTDLREAYLEARAGFADCAAGGQQMDYRLMARGDSELAAANTWLARARSAR